MTYIPVVYTLAEAAAFDFRGNPTLVGLVGPEITMQTFPGQLSPALIAVLQQDDASVGQAPHGQTSVTISVTDPIGNVIFFVQQEVPMSDGPYDPELPHRVQMVASINFTVATEGTHRVMTTLGLPGQSVELNQSVRIRSGG